MALAPSISDGGKPNRPQPPALPGFEKINRYWDKIHGYYAAKILPGEYYVTTHSELIVTVLGSCISACIRDPIFGIGGMNHFMLPSQGPSGGGWNAAGTSDSTRYGNFAMEHMINDILKNGGAKKNLEVKIFGGGRILAQMTDIGSRNISFVRDYIRVEGLKMLAEDVGDIHPRKVMFHPTTGKVKVKKLRSLHNNTIVERETAYLGALEEKPVAGEIDLF